ncbi:MAG: hypothetical protein RLN63_08410, partial [Miltoncostaeaceae bacterium]
MSTAVALLQESSRLTGTLMAPWCFEAGTGGGEPWWRCTAPAALDHWLEVVCASDPVGRRPRAVAASFLMGWLAGAVLGPGVALITGCGRAPCLGPERLHVRRHPDGWVEATGLAPAALWTAGGDGRCAGCPGAHACHDLAEVRSRFALAARGCIEPVVDALTDLSPRPPRTLRGAMADAAHSGAAVALAAGHRAEAARLWRTAGAVVDAMEYPRDGVPAPRPRVTAAMDDPACRVVRGTCCLA